MNITEITPKNKLQPDKPQKPKREANYVIWRDEVAEELQKRHHFDEAERWDYCDTSPRYIVNKHQIDLPPSADIVWVCSASNDHDSVLFSPSCDLRICPDCAKRHTARFMNRFVPAIEKMMTLHREHRLRSITLTTKIKLGSNGFKDAVSRGFVNIRKAMRKAIGPRWLLDGSGMIVNWEVGANGLLLHYHIIYFGPWVSYPKLKEAWYKLTGDAYIVWVTQVKHNDGDWQGAVSEVLKYATKFYSEDKTTGERIYLSATLTVDLFEALKATRRLRAWGSLYNIGEPSDRVFCCETCDSKMVRIHVSHFEIWKATGFTEDGWKSAIRESLLYLRRADKLPEKKVKYKPPDKRQRGMSELLDQIPLKKATHYDHE